MIEALLIKDGLDSPSNALDNIEKKATLNDIKERYPVPSEHEGATILRPGNDHGFIIYKNDELKEVVVAPPTELAMRDYFVPNGDADKLLSDESHSEKIVFAVTDEFYKMPLHSIERIESLAEIEVVSSESSENSSIVTEEVKSGLSNRLDFAEDFELSENETDIASEVENDEVTISDRPTPRESEITALEKYGGEEQVSYKNGEVVPYGTPGSTRPDIVIEDENGNLTAIEVKNYDVSTPTKIDSLCKEVRRQVGERCENMPEDTNQVVVVDVRGQNLTKEQIEELKSKIKDACSDVYEDIDVDIITE